MNDLDLFYMFAEEKARNAVIYKRDKKVAKERNKLAAQLKKERRRRDKLNKIAAVEELRGQRIDSKIKSDREARKTKRAIVKEHRKNTEKYAKSSNPLNRALWKTSKTIKKGVGNVARGITAPIRNIKESKINRSTKKLSNTINNRINEGNVSIIGGYLSPKGGKWAHEAKNTVIESRRPKRRLNIDNTVATVTNLLNPYEGVKMKVNTITDLANKWGKDSFKESNFINKSTGEFDKRLYNKERKKYLKDVRRIARYIRREASLSRYGDTRGSQILNMMNPFYSLKKRPRNKKYMRKVSMRVLGNPMAMLNNIRLSRKVNKLQKKYIH